MQSASGPLPSCPAVSSTAGSPCSARAAEEGRQALADQPLADVRVAVAIRAELDGRVVDVQRLQARRARSTRRARRAARRPRRGRRRRCPSRRGARCRGTRRATGGRRSDRSRAPAPRPSGPSCRRRRRCSRAAARCRRRPARARARAPGRRARGRPSKPLPRCEPRCTITASAPSAARRAQRLRERGLGALDRQVVRAREVDQVRRVADGHEPGLAGQLAGSARRLSSGCTAGFHTRGLCGKTCSERQPSSVARPTASSIPPALETWAPNSTARSLSGGSPRMRPSRRSRLRSTPVASPVRTRFAPSPTGLLHVGGVRTALFSWLYARHHGGRFVLRIEDTDETREHPEAIEQIQRSLRWVGLEWDEGPGVGGEYGPYIQSERRAAPPRGRASASSPRGAPTAATARPRSSRRSARPRSARTARSSTRAAASRCSAEERAAREAAGAASVVRLRVPDEGACVVEDLVRGSVRFEYAQLGDHVILRSDGVPTYNFANPIDDADMRHHARDPRRGPAQLDAAPGARARGARRAGAGASPTCRCSSAPIASASRSATARPASRSCREAGYLAEAVVNFLALLGWHFDSERELFTREELVGLFSLERVNPAPAVFDAKKLEWMNGVYLRALPTVRPRRAPHRLPRGSAARRSPRSPTGSSRCTPLAQEKIATLAEFEPLCSLPLRADRDRARGLGRAWRGTSAPPRSWRPCRRRSRPASGRRRTIEATLRAVCEQLELKPRVVFGLVRVAVTGSSISPGLFESVHLLGRDEALARLSGRPPRLG